MLGWIIVIGLVILSFKICGFVLKLCGKLLGGIFSIIGYFLIGVLGVAGFGIAFVAIPIILVIGIATIIGHARAI